MLRFFPVVLLALMLNAFAQVTVGSAQTSCPIPPPLPSEAEFNECKACVQAERKQTSDTLIIAANGVLLKNVVLLKFAPKEVCDPKFYYKMIAELVTVGAVAEYKGYIERAKCAAKPACQKVLKFTGELDLYKMKMTQALAAKDKKPANPAATPKAVTCYFEEKISLSGGTYMLCAKGTDYRFRVKTGTTASVGIPGNSPDFHAAHFTCGPWKCGKAKDNQISSPTCELVKFAEKCP